MRNHGRVTHIVCIKCNVCVNPQIIEDDYICEACRDLSMSSVYSLHEASGIDDQQPGPSHRGHASVCLLCGCSILQSDRILRDNPTGLHQLMYTLIGNRIAPRQITETDKVCYPCWLTQREARRTHDVNRQQSETEVLSTTDEPIPTEVLSTMDKPIPAEVPSTMDEPIPAEVLSTMDEPIPAEVPSTMDEPIPAEVPLTMDEPIPAEVLSTMDEPIPAEVPSTMDKPIPAEVLSTMDEPIPAEVLSTMAEPIPAEVPSFVSNKENRTSNHITLPDYRRAANNNKRCISASRCELDNYNPTNLSLNDNLKIICQNIRSINKNFDEFETLLVRTKILWDLVVLTECRLQRVNNIPSLLGYDTYSSINNILQNDGVVVYIKKNISASVQYPILANANCLQIKVDNHTIILAIYRSPSKKNITPFLNSIRNTLTEIDQTKNIIIIGDLNINIGKNSTDRNKKKYSTLLASYGLLAAHKLPTRLTNCLDHVMLKSNSRAQVLIAPTKITDHDTIIFYLEDTTAKPTKNKITRKLKN